MNWLIGFSLLIFIFMAMGLLEVEDFGRNLGSLGDRANAQRLVDAAVKIARKFRQYMLVRTIASIATGLIVWIFALIVGIELAAAWGVITFALNYIPFIGPLIATALPTLFVLLQTGSTELAVFVLVDADDRPVPDRQLFRAPVHRQGALHLVLLRGVRGVLLGFPLGSAGNLHRRSDRDRLPHHLRAVSGQPLDRRSALAAARRKRSRTTPEPRAVGAVTPSARTSGNTKLRTLEELKGVAPKFMSREVES